MTTSLSNSYINISNNVSMRNLTQFQPYNKISLKTLAAANVNSTSNLYPTTRTAYDPYFANVILLLHLENATDSSLNNYPMTLYGSPSPIQSKLLLTGQPATFKSTNVLTTTNITANTAYIKTTNPIIALGSQPFTIEGWIYIPTGVNQSATRPYIIGNTSPVTAGGAFNYGLNNWYIYVNTNRSISMNSYNNSPSNNLIQATMYNISYSTWTHFAIVRNINGVFTLYINGRLGITINGSSTFSLDGGIPAPISVGSDGSSGTYFWGSIDEVRITKGVARYTSAFTPPTTIFPSTVPLSSFKASANLYQPIMYLDANVGIATTTKTTWTDQSKSGASYNFVINSAQVQNNNNGLNFINCSTNTAAINSNVGISLYNNGSYTGSTIIAFTKIQMNTIAFGTLDGSTSANAAPSALAIMNLYSTTGKGIPSDGVYWINLPTVGPTQIYCIMNPNVNGGGWMMAMKSVQNSTTFNYNASYWTTPNIYPTTIPTAAISRLGATANTSTTYQDVKFHTMNYYPGSELLALWPDCITSPGAGGSLGTNSTNNPYGCWSWQQNYLQLYSTTGPVTYSPMSMINFFSTAQNLSPYKLIPNPYNTGVYINDQNGLYYPSFTGWSSTYWSTENGGPQNFYGFNFNLNGGAAVRWGFAFNNETEWYSNDVGGGIGMNKNSWSAGDWIGCCQNTVGMNRSAQVEVYVR